jgi:hypothetical protein
VKLKDAQVKMKLADIWLKKLLILGPNIPITRLYRSVKDNEFQPFLIVLLAYRTEQSKRLRSGRM